MKYLLAVCVGGCAVAFSVFLQASAQTPPGENVERMDPAARDEPPPLSAPAQLPAISADIAAPQLSGAPITLIRFEGAAVPAAVARAAEPFVGKPIAIETLQALTTAMSAAYGRSTVALFTIVVPEQNFAEGVVRVLVAEGYVESAILTGETKGRDMALVKAYAARIAAERPTSRATLERYLSLINQIPGLKAEAKLQTGSRKGAVRLVLDLDYKRPTASFGFDNRTSRFVEDGQFSAEGKVFGLLREGDETRLNFSAAVNFEDSLYAGLQHSTPALRDGARLDIGVAALKSRPRDVPIVGDAQIYSVGASYPVFLSYRRSLNLRASAEALNSDNAAFGSLLAEERTRSLRFAARYAQSGPRHSAALTAGLSRGFEVFGARVTEPLGRPGYLKARGEVSIARKISGRGLLRLSAAGQWTQDTLPANERFSVGGANFGRAFETGLVSADRGFAVLAEPAVRPFRTGPLAKSELYAFADYAQASILPRGAATMQTTDLGSAGFGIRAAMRDRATLELEFAHPYDRPADSYPGGWRVSVRWKVNFRP
ncbi:MAG: ShlB/FhaC/HecB family hemolysin secretion/activation protein [Pseudomonadota bacterium]|nr:ShlB/FhaC/HecB family hemolysin secretion/activation protein [Pseudomonadota bacterium]